MMRVVGIRWVKTIQYKDDDDDDDEDIDNSNDDDDDDDEDIDNSNDNEDIDNSDDDMSSVALRCVLPDAVVLYCFGHCWWLI